jgi:hypothetical protein
VKVTTVLREDSLLAVETLDTVELECDENDRQDWVELELVLLLECDELECELRDDEEWLDGDEVELLLGLLLDEGLELLLEEKLISVLLLELVELEEEKLISVLLLELVEEDDSLEELELLNSASASWVSTPTPPLDK